MTEYEPNGRVKVERHELDAEYTYFEEAWWVAHCTCGKSISSSSKAGAERIIAQHAADMNRNLDA